MRRVFEEPEDELVSFGKTKKTGLISDNGLKIIAGALAVIGGALSFLGQHPKGYWIFAGLAAFVVVLILLPRATSLVKRIQRKRDAKRYVAQEFPKLKDFYKRLGPFLNENDGRSFLSVLRDASPRPGRNVNAVLSCNYISAWTWCYGEHLNKAPHSIAAFLQACNEFTAIVNQFNGNYVIRTQEGLERTPLSQQHHIDRFEGFREEFAHYLRDLEGWIKSVIAEVQQKEPSLFRNPQAIPATYFPRPKSFRPTIVVRQSS